MENLRELASENMTEGGIHHDDWPDQEHEYIDEILKELAEMNQ